jgi:two-component system sensor histidine kinase KdpD
VFVGRSSPRLLRALVLAVALTALATAPAALPVRVHPATAALGYVLAVVIAAAWGGLPAGLAASVLSFLALNFFFTPPFHTLTVGQEEDVVALAVFLVVSVIVGSLVSRALSQRARAERREREARLLHHVSARLLSGEPFRRVLERFAEAVTELFGLARCEVFTDVEPEPVRREGRVPEGGEPEVFAMAAGERPVGRVVAVPGVRPLGEEERGVLRTFAGQMGLAIEGIRLGTEAERARMDAETNRLRAALFSSVTHDLRTPLASITASVTSLEGAGEDLALEDRADHLETIRQEAERLNRLVGNLMHLARIRAGALVPERTPAAIGEVIEGVVARLRPVLEGHRVRLVLRQDLPTAAVDVVQIDQALTNLLENAARYSPPGTEISVYGSRFQDSVEVRVADRGPGIPLEERDRVLEPFVRGDGAQGTGLGLSIARAIVESHGGRIWIQETPGGGATVTFRLPVR